MRGHQPLREQTTAAIANLHGIRIDLMGAPYVAVSGTASLPGLGSVDNSGNALLEISDGLLPGTITKHLNIWSNDSVTKIPTTDASYTLSITSATGAVSGSFTHPGHATLKPAIKAVILQKGDTAGAYGHFLSPVPPGSTTPGESGGVTLSAK